jgi:hypothetical protein
MIWINPWEGLVLPKHFFSKMKLGKMERIEMKKDVAKKISNVLVQLKSSVTCATTLLLYGKGLNWVVYSS